MPCVVRWPGKVPAGTECDEVTVTFDLLPTFAKLAGAELPQRTIDGRRYWRRAAVSTRARRVYRLRAKA